MARNPRRRRWRIGLGILLLVGTVVALLVMPWWRERQMRTSCEQGHGRWEAEAERCTFGGLPAISTDTNSSSNIQPAPEPK